MEASKVGLKTLLLLKLDVKGNKVDERQLQVISSRIIHISNESLGILSFFSGVGARESTLDAPQGVAARDGRRELIADHVVEDSWVADTGRQPGAYALRYR